MPQAEILLLRGLIGGPASGAPVALQLADALRSGVGASACGLPMGARPKDRHRLTKRFGQPARSAPTRRSDAKLDRTLWGLLEFLGELKRIPRFRTARPVRRR